jgi:hypothetical protein
VAFTYSKDEVRNLLAGYEVLDLRQDHIFPYVVEKYVRYEYVRKPWFEAMPPGMFAALENSLGWHLLATCQLAR